MTSVDHYRTYLLTLNETLDRLPVELIRATVEQIHRARVNHRQLFIIGNGGSAATASHFACDLAKNTVSATLPRLRVQTLNDNMAFFSACANDYGSRTISSWPFPAAGIPQMC
jgi:D-sedoheptulose 7-phosphate isomerase